MKDDLPEGVLEEPPEDLRGWSQEDLALLKGLPEEMQLVARRYGRVVWTLTMHSGAVQQGILIINAQARGNRRIAEALAVISKAFNDTCLRALLGAGRSSRELFECRADLERLQSLMQGGKQPGDRVSKGGILLDS